MSTPHITLLLHNIRSAYNVGAILRTADGTGVEAVISSGYTPRFDDPRLLPHLRQKLNHQIAKSALGAELTLPQQGTDDPLALLDSYRSSGYRLVGLENNLSSDELSRRLIVGQHSALYAPSGPSPTVSKNAPLKTSAPPNSAAPILLVLGEEVSGIPAPLRSRLDFFLEIPMRGQKESFNVSVATGIALWALISQAQTT